MAEEYERLPMPKVRIGQIWSHHQDCTHFLIIGATGVGYKPWKARIVKENPVRVRDRSERSFVGYETEFAMGAGTVNNPAWYLVEDAFPCPQCEQRNYIPEDDYICEECRG